ncbi:hypothetical protein K432DRAFT_376782 [Lepidopterella palustris CBS 459.81]|uniref:N-acetyltransferase domain-containing protein n=1 Tax=Lepidopterella palustris CBS 459.81 TaxID=1314670 RepID=A0A8E2EM37_9PEZI|nr:hypothetical protein K432DRAFT_376782 [Lepidopterella palustris CBS 459.81]
MLSKKRFVTLLPKICDNQGIWESLVSQQKEFRLASLKVAPEAFSSKYERESQFERSVWESRLKNPMAFTFVAIATEDTSPSTAELRLSEVVRLPWAGMLVLVAVMDEATTGAPSHTPSECFRPHDKLDTPHLEFQLNAMFVQPAARGLGLGKALIEAAIAYGQAVSEDKGSLSTRFTVLVGSENLAAINLYRKAGFKATGEEVGGRIDTVPVSLEDTDTTLMEMWVD